MVVRRDGLELLPRHAEVLCFFCKYVVEEVVGVGSAGLAEDKERQWVQRKMLRKLLCKKGFLEFYDDYCLERSFEDPGWRGLPSPFDVRVLSGGVAVCNQIDRGVRAVVKVEDEPDVKARGRCRYGSGGVKDEAVSPDTTAGDEPRGRARFR